jgi:hypothetical protein
MEIHNFESDGRVRAKRRKKRWDRHVTINEEEKEAKVEIDDIVSKVPFKWQLCPVCEGDGSVVDPAVDSSGLATRDMAPEVREAYHSGSHDTECPECEGRRVAPLLCPENAPQEEMVETLQERIKSGNDVDQMRRAERMRGA